jgi:hypothetical protein
MERWGVWVEGHRVGVEEPGLRAVELATVQLPSDMGSSGELRGPGVIQAILSFQTSMM